MKNEIRFKLVENVKEETIARDWMRKTERQPEFNFRKDSKIFVAIKNKKIIAVTELMNQPVLSMSFGRDGNVHQTIRTFDMIRAAMDIMNIRPIALIDSKSPLYGCAQGKMVKINSEYFYM